MSHHNLPHLPHVHVIKTHDTITPEHAFDELYELCRDFLVGWIKHICGVTIIWIVFCLVPDQSWLAVLCLAWVWFALCFGREDVWRIANRWRAARPSIWSTCFWERPSRVLTIVFASLFASLIGMPMTVLLVMWTDIKTTFLLILTRPYIVLASVLMLLVTVFYRMPRRYMSKLDYAQRQKREAQVDRAE